MKYKTCPKCKAPMQVQIVAENGLLFSDPRRVSVVWRCARASCAHELPATDDEEHAYMEEQDRAHPEGRIKDTSTEGYDDREYTRQQMRSGHSRFGTRGHK